jgi:hypothetical protein
LGGVDCGPWMYSRLWRRQEGTSMLVAGQLLHGRHRLAIPLAAANNGPILSRPDDAKAAHPALPRPLPSLPGERGGPQRRTPRARNPHAANASQHGERRGPWVVGRGDGYLRVHAAWLLQALAGGARR